MNGYRRNTAWVVRITGFVFAAAHAPASDRYAKITKTMCGCGQKRNSSSPSSRMAWVARSRVKKPAASPSKRFSRANFSKLRRQSPLDLSDDQVVNWLCDTIRTANTNIVERAVEQPRTARHGHDHDAGIRAQQPRHYRPRRRQPRLSGRWAYRSASPRSPPITALSRRWSPPDI